MSWYYSKNGVQLGPVSVEEIRAKISTGEVVSTDMVWKDGMGDWLPLAQVAELQDGVAVAGGAAPAMMQQPGSYKPPMGMQPPITNYLWQSIVVTLLCCLPFGVVGIVYAAKVEGLQARGDIAGAMAAAKSAKTWTLAGFITGFVIIAAYLVLVFSIGMAGAM